MKEEAYMPPPEEIGDAESRMSEEEKLLGDKRHNRMRPPLVFQEQGDAEVVLTADGVLQRKRNDAIGEQSLTGKQAIDWLDLKINSRTKEINEYRAQTDTLRKMKERI